MITRNTSASKRILTGFAAVLGLALAAFEAVPAQAAPPKHAPAWGNRRKQQQTKTRTNRNYQHGGYRNTTRDIDGDGIPNTRDNDIDGDGISNSRDRNDYVRGHGPRSVPAGYYRDRNGRLIRRRTPAKNVNQHPVWRKVNRRSGDRDNDGIRNRRDRDLDGDGIRNKRDRDRDNDGVRNRNDKYDRRPNRR